MTVAALWLLPLTPVSAGAVLLLLSEQRASAVAGPTAMIVSALCTGFAIPVWQTQPSAQFFWLPYADSGFALQLTGAGANAPLALLVTLISLLVLMYAQGYLEKDEDRSRFFGLMLLFLGGMTLIVLAADLLTVLLGWELVGACSYGLIGFWHAERKRIRAGLRAFVTTRSTDLGLYVTIMAAFADGGVLMLDALPAHERPWLDVLAAGLLLAALGKSAQLPFAGWLSGAMEGPTPVSALLHSATMVAAGAILLLKTAPLLATAGWPLPLLLWLGLATALLGGVIALHQKELKQLLAASTVSQYGYIFAALGTGLVGVAPATTQLINHAAYKSLLFLGAGVLVQQGMRRFRTMGGLRRVAPLTAVLFALVALALAGLPPLGGFFSKETIVSVISEYSHAAYIAVLVAGLITAAYAARAWFATFAGQTRSDCARAAHDPAFLLSVPMLCLAAAALLLGALVLPPLKEPWTQRLVAESLPAFSWGDAILSVFVALIAIVWIAVRHRRGELVPMRHVIAIRLARAAYRWFGLVTLLDTLGRAALATARLLDRIEQSRPTAKLAAAMPHPARVSASFERQVLDRILVVGVSKVSLAAARGAWLGDRRWLDGAIAQLNQFLHKAAAGLGWIQSGLLHQYYLWFCLGTGVLLLYALMLFGYS